MKTSEIVKKQREYFETCETFSVKFRREQLKKLLLAIEANKQEIFAALKADLGKTEIESYMSEIGMVVTEIKYLLKNLRKFAKAKRVRGELSNFPAKYYSMPVPKGNVLIMSPWNYPLLLTLEPLADVMAAGNTAVVKPSAYSPATSEVVKKIIEENFEPNYIAVVTGGRDANKDLLEQKFDHIFFTGSKTVGHEVLKHAEKNMTPVTLELGGKSPCIVDKTANIKIAARRIIFGKLMNVGQTCVAPDYVLAHKEIFNELLKELKNEIAEQYGTSTLNNINYGKIISEKHFERLTGLLADQKIYCGGKCSREQLKIEPTIIKNPKLNSQLMNEEIFGPILPVVPYETEREAYEIIQKNPTPLALYVFTCDKGIENYFLKKVQFGGGCVNDTLMHITSSRLAFGGVGTSGMGAYHGKRGFDTFSHYKSIVKKGKVELTVRYRPMTKTKEKLIRKFM